MPLENGSGYSNSGPLIFLNARTKDKDGKKCKPHFTVDRPVGDKKFERDPVTFDKLKDVDLFRVEIKERTYNNKTYHDWVFYFRDTNQPADGSDKQSYRLPLSPTFSSRDVVNRLATLLDTGDFTNLTLSYYENKKGKDAFYLQRGVGKDAGISWKYNLDEIPKPYELTDPRTGEVVKRDYAEVDAFFEAIVSQIAQALGGDGQVTQSGQKQAASDEAAGNESATEDQAVDEPQQEQQPNPAPKPAPRPAARPTAPAAAAKPAAKPVQATAPKQAAPKTATPAAKRAPRPTPKPAANEQTGNLPDVPF